MKIVPCEIDGRTKVNGNSEKALGPVFPNYFIPLYTSSLGFIQSVLRNRLTCYHSEPEPFNSCERSN